MLQRGHPIREILDMAVLGKLPTKAQLDELAERDDVPDGHGLARFRDRVSRAAAELVKLHDADGGLGRSQARSWEIAAELDAAMSDEQRAVKGEAHPEPLGDIARRMFTF